MTQISDPILGAIPTVRERSVIHSLDHVVAILKQLQNPAYWAEHTVAAYMREHPQLGSSDRLIIGDLVFTIVRWQRRIAAALGVSGEMLYTCEEHTYAACAVLLCIAGYSPDTIDAALPDTMQVSANAAWRESLASALLSLDPTQATSAAALGIRASYPDWIVDRLVSQYGFDRARAILVACQQRAPVTLRVNTLRTSRDSVLEALTADGIAARQTEISPWGIELDEPVNLRGHRLYREGAVEIQDEGSQLLALLVDAKPEDRVIDACAGAGGKALCLAAMMEDHGELIAFDTDKRKLRELDRRARRAGCSILRSHRAPVDLRRVGSADAVLVDAPCSGSGTWRRIPDGPQHLDPSRIAELVATQCHILSHYASFTKPGGRLVYATCSIFREENEGVVESWLKSEECGRMFRRIPIEKSGISEHVVSHVASGPYFALTPEQFGTDGFFAAVMERVA